MDPSMANRAQKYPCNSTYGIARIELISNEINELND